MLLCSEKTYSSRDQVRLLYARFFLVFEPEIRQSEFLLWRPLSLPKYSLAANVLNPK